MRVLTMPAMMKSEDSLTDFLAEKGEKGKVEYYRVAIERECLHKL